LKTNEIERCKKIEYKMARTILLNTECGIRQRAVFAEEKEEKCNGFSHECYKKYLTSQLSGQYS
jgi:hypothetical protein